MRSIPVRYFLVFLLFLSLQLANNPVYCQEPERSENLDEKVRQFLDNHRGTWRDFNVPESDGQILYDLIIEHHYTKALEIGTSTGHSAIWIAWALSKTGGKLVTVEIDEQRYKTALSNFKEAVEIDEQRYKSALSNF